MSTSSIKLLTCWFLNVVNGLCTQKVLSPLPNFKFIVITNILYINAKQIVRALEGDVSLDDLDNGTRTANQDQGSSSDYNTRAYNEDLKKFRKMALESTGEGGADDTSTYGLNPSISSDGSREMK